MTRCHFQLIASTPALSEDVSILYANTITIDNNAHGELKGLFINALNQVILPLSLCK